ncbi:RloB domain-containing protein [Algoriphagus ratkowskyi]|uniref:RloB domain-containing protein n=1 Tax=Algoriphagus ratkowskyi TaxID=57028 RepID=A0ABY3HM97_9BACT|nr:RloB domain-containing protein [Algoriphagus ratkowskyi]
MHYTFRNDNHLFLNACPHHFRKREGHLESITHVTVIINQPCIEFWLLLHFEFTQAPFDDCGRAESRLKSHLTDYSKSQKYYTKEGDDIYLKLKERLPTAIANSQRFAAFDLETPDKGYSEMLELFKILGLLKEEKGMWVLK